MCQCSFVGIYFQIQRPVETAAVALKKGTGARVWWRVAEWIDARCYEKKINKKKRVEVWRPAESTDRGGSRAESSQAHVALCAKRTDLNLSAVQQQRPFTKVETIRWTKTGRLLGSHYFCQNQTDVERRFATWQLHRTGQPGSMTPSSLHPEAINRADGRTRCV